MSGLLDVGELMVEVTVGRYKISVKGLTVEDIFFLVSNFDEIRAILERKISQVTPKALMAVAPTILATIIAIGTGEYFENKETSVAAALRLPAAGQLRLITTIFDLTFPEGVGPFVTELGAIRSVFLAPPKTQEGIENQTETSSESSSERVSAALQMDTLAVTRFVAHPAASKRGRSASKRTNAIA